MADWTLEALGPEAALLRFGERIDPALVPVIRAAADRLAAGLRGAVRELIPSYTTLMIEFDPLRLSPAELSEAVGELLAGLSADEVEEGRRVEIPAYYHPSVGPDLERVAAHTGLSTDEVIRHHTGRDYWVFAIGFAPGFAYMGPVADELATPRLSTPRQRVPVGSVALAERQTAVYPIATPGGWNLLGRAATRMFDRRRETLCPVRAGDRVRFVAVGRAEFVREGGELE